LEGGSLNLVLITEGYVRACLDDLEPPFDTLASAFSETEALAQKEKKGAWAHGNLGDDDDNQDY
jgi:endonuclease YncB( thermonuclease family)